MKPLIILLMLPAALCARAQTVSIEQAIGLARTNRPALAAARLRVEEAKAARSALASFPATALLAGYTSDLRVGGSDDDLVLTQPIDIFGRSSAGRASGNALVLQAQANLRVAELDLQAGVIDLYIEAASAEAKLATARDAEQSAKLLLDAIRALVDGGKLPGVQATRVSIELDRAAAERNLRASELTSVQLRLKAAIGSSEAIETGGFPEIPTVEIPRSELATDRPDLLLLSAEAQGAEAEARISRANRLPQLEIQGRRSPWQDSDPVFGARIQLSFPLFDSGKGRSEVTAAQKRAQAARLSLEDATRIAVGEIEAARVETQGASEQVATLERIVQTARDLVARTQTGLKEGVGTLIDVLDATRALRESDEELIDARARLAAAKAKYLKAAGVVLEVRP